MKDGKMVDRVLRLDIKPLVTYSDGKKRKTTLTSFEAELKRKESSLTTTEEDVNKADSESENSVSPDKTICFRDPSTGRAVQYEDVAKATSKSSETDSAQKTEETSESSKTTTADSMKKTKYDEYFKKAAQKYNVSESLLKAIAKAESNFNAKCVSSAGAMGVMQLMPATAKSLGVSNPYDPEQNIMGGAKCISQKLKEFNGDERLALAAYNAGSGAVKRYGGVPSYCKTYVNRVQSYKKAYETAAAV